MNTKRTVQPSTISIGMIDPNKLFREALKLLLTNRQFEVPLECDRMEELTQEHSGDSKIRLVLIDIPAFADGTRDRLRLLCDRNPTLPIVVLTESNDATRMEACFASGVQGYLMKSISPDALDHSLRLVMLGEKVYPTGLAEMLLSPASSLPASPEAFNVL